MAKKPATHSALGNIVVARATRAVRKAFRKPSRPRLERFALEYMVDWNATEAAKRAGYAKKCANVAGARALKNAYVQQLIEDRQKILREKNEVTVERIVEELRRIGVADLRQLFNENGQLIPPQALPAEVAAAIASVEVVTRNVPGGEPGDVEYVSKVKAWDKPRALELLGKYLGILVDRTKTEHSGAVGLVPIDPARVKTLSDEELRLAFEVAKKLTAGNDGAQ